MQGSFEGKERFGLREEILFAGKLSENIIPSYEKIEEERK